MNSASGDTASAPRFRLRAFGSLALLGAAGETVVGEHGQQRRRLALLAALAAAGEHGRTRDQLLLLFWPDASQSRARHSLDQLVYAIRTSIGDDVFAGANPLRLNPDAVRSDVGDFNDAIARDDLDGAVQLYVGPFLDGFYLSDAPEFEQWMDAERARLARSYGGALERLAERAAAAGDHGAAVAWWRRLSEADPVSSKAAIGLMRSLAGIGDHAAALRHAEQYERVVRQELGTGAGAAIAAMAAELRAAASAPPPPASRPTAADHGAERGAQSAPAAESTTPAFEPATPVPSRPPPPTQSPPRTEAAKADRPTRARLVPALMAIGAIVGLGAMATVVLRSDPSPPDQAGVTPRTAARSIVVLPLTNLSAVPADAPIVDGLTEELIGMLSRIDGLRVIARTSAFAFRNSALDVGDIADSLHVANVLAGSVQKDGQRLRVQVRLMDALDGSTRWSETYDRELRDLFAVQSEIATAVARELDLRLGERSASAIQRRPTRSIAAYELYLRGRDPTLFRSDEGANRGLTYLQQAVALDSTFAGAYANMTYMYMLLSQRVDVPQTNEFISLAKAAAQKAVALDPLLPEAHAAVGVTGLVRLRDLAGAESAFKRALALPGYSRAREHLARLYLHTGRPVEGLAETQRAVEEDPLSATAAAEVGLALCVNRRYEEGLAQLARLATLQPPLRRIGGFVATCHAMRGAWQDVVATMEPPPGTIADPIRENALYGYALARAGRADEARQRLPELVEGWRLGRKTAFSIALIHAGLGDYDQGVLWLNRSIDDFSLQGIVMYPMFAELHAHPGFERIRRRLGLQNR
ncbi:MAG TPA: BTAD domain-containing putative transcriptional regulator [Gemmatimonadaceae bacterium]